MAFTYPGPGAALPFDDVIDVRSPAEFAEDHLPGALNLPALDDAQRAEVGTIYTRESPFKARRIGAAMVARNVARYLEGPLADRPRDWRPLVYCWRGGQRSGAVAIILRQIGWQVETLDGGYRSYRRAVQGYLYDGTLAHRLVLLDGGTGTAKTELLARLARLGHQTLDLEALAAHRGSLFGATGPQPGQKAFETALAAALAGLDPNKPTLAEAESSKIGARLLPPALWRAMCAAPRIRIHAPLAARAAYTLATYRDIARDAGRLDAILAALVPYHGRARVDAWRAMAAARDLAPLVTELMAEHYDPRYAKSAARREQAPLAEIDAPELTAEGLDRTARDISRILETAVR